MDNKITLKIILKNQKGELVNGEVRIEDGVAVSVFSDKFLAKNLYEAEKKSGNQNVDYNKILNAFVEKFPNLNMQQIAFKISEELKKSGGKIDTI